MQAKVEVSSLVRAILSEGCMTHAQLASEMGVNEDRVTSLATGKVKKFHPDEIMALVNKSGVSMSFLETGEPPVFKSKAIEPGFVNAEQFAGNLGGRSSARLIAEDFVTVPRYDVQASAGGGALIHSEQIVDYLAFRADWVRNALGVSQKDLALIEVHGDSMEPTLSNGDLILLDMRHRHVVDNGVYAIQRNGCLLVKRIQQRLDGTVVVKSDNPRYEPETVQPEEGGHFETLGRVVWAGRRM